MITVAYELQDNMKHYSQVLVCGHYGCIIEGKKKKWCMLFDHEPNTAWVVELEKKKAFKINFILFFNAYDIYYSCKM